MRSWVSFDNFDDKGLFFTSICVGSVENAARGSHFLPGVLHVVRVLNIFLGSVAERSRRVVSCFII